MKGITTGRILIDIESDRANEGPNVIPLYCTTTESKGLDTESLWENSTTRPKQYIRFVYEHVLLPKVGYSGNPMEYDSAVPLLQLDEASKSSQ